MRILLSPAKKMVEDTDTFAPEQLPALLTQTRRLLAAMRALPEEDLQALWKCNPAIARLNVERLRTMELERAQTPALLAYEGIQYRYLAPGVLERGELDYLRTHLRILSGFYGVLRPFDGVTPYRLEMQTRLHVDGCRDLYAFWGDRLAALLAAETNLVVDLASREYSRAVIPHLPGGVRLVRCTFGVLENGRVVEKGTLCKMARGQMVRWMAGQGVDQPDQLRAFSQLGYRYAPEHSQPDHYVFLKSGA